MNASEVLASTCDPAFAVDRDGAIVAWNTAAEEFLGYRRREVVGRKCWEVLRGRDIYGNRYCSEHCPLRANAFRGDAVHSVQMYFRAGAGERILVSVSCLLVDGRTEARANLVHLLSSVGPLEQTVVAAPARSSDDPNRVRLSPRRREILRLLADGQGTRQISELLGISVSTTRNHIQGVLARLKVHNRLEAVALARRIGLV